jgi:hypothetical protein
VADLPLALDGPLAGRLARALDREARIPRALEALGPVADRDIALLDGAAGLRATQLAELGARVRWDDAPGAADVVVGLWSAVRGGAEPDIAEAERLARPGGRLLLVHDYGRDDVSRLLGEPPEPLEWSRRDGPFLGSGFRIRVIHCFWTFDGLEELRAFVTDAFGAAGAAVAETVQRPRLSYNIAVYHRTVGAHH